MLCKGSTLSGCNCSLEHNHFDECFCVDCGNAFKPEPPPRKPQVRVVPADEIDSARSLLAKDYMKGNGWGPKDLLKYMEVRKVEQPIVTRLNAIDLADKAHNAAVAQQWAKAARLYREAAGASIGAERSEWYERQAVRCASKILVK